MGLDMYLYKAKRMDGITPRDIETVQCYLDWKEERAKGNVRAKCSMEKWCGVPYKDVPRKAINFYRPYFVMRYWLWDKARQYGHKMIYEEVGYWRKANAIHNWFCDNVQGGVDNCGSYEVTKIQLTNLLDTCKLVKEKFVIKPALVEDGAEFVDGKWKPNMIDGEVITNTEVAEELLPTCSGFFFGSTDYDDWYIRQIDNTIEILTKVLAETDFDKEIVYYSANW